LTELVLKNERNQSEGEQLTVNDSEINQLKTNLLSILKHSEYGQEIFD